MDPPRSGCGGRRSIGQLSQGGPSGNRIRRLPRIPRSGKSNRFALRGVLLTTVSHAKSANLTRAQRGSLSPLPRASPRTPAIPGAGWRALRRTCTAHLPPVFFAARGLRGTPAGEITSRATCGGAGPFSHAGRATPTDALAKISHKPDGLITRERVCLEGPGTRFALSRRAVCPRRNRPARFACAGSVGLPAYCRRGIMRLRIPSRAATAAARAPFRWALIPPSPSRLRRDGTNKTHRPGLLRCSSAGPLACSLRSRRRRPACGPPR